MYFPYRAQSTYTVVFRGCPIDLQILCWDIKVCPTTHIHAHRELSNEAHPYVPSNRYPRSRINSSNMKFLKCLSIN